TRRCEPVTSSTPAVHVGARSSTGIASAASVGRNTQWKPSSLMRIAATARSRASLNGEANPSPKSGAMAICTASAARARIRAARMLPRVACVGSLEGAVELVGSIDDLLRQWSLHGIDCGIELLDGGGAEQDRIHSGSRRDPLVRQLDARASCLGCQTREGIRQIEEALGQVAALVHGVAVEAGARLRSHVARHLAGEKPAGERIVDGGVYAVFPREAEVLDLELAHEQVVHLLRDARLQAGLDHLQQLPGGEVRDAECAHLAGRDQLLNRPQRWLQRTGVLRRALAKVHRADDQRGRESFASGIEVAVHGGGVYAATNCFSTSRRYNPSSRRSVACGPLWTMRPASRTTTRCASFTVDSRCAM